MRILFACLLHAVHFIYIFFIKIHLFCKQLSSATPKPLQAPRRRTPKHLAVVFVIDPNIFADTVEAALTENALKIVEWCQTIGIPKLTFYEEHGARHRQIRYNALTSWSIDRLSKCERTLQDHLSIHGSEAESSESETEYPLTPPPSDYSDSRPLSPNHHQANKTITLHVSQHVPSQEVRNLRKRRSPRNFKYYS